MQRPQFQTGTLSSVDGMAQLQSLLAQQQGGAGTGTFQVMGSADMGQRFTLAAAPVQMLGNTYHVMTTPSSMPANTTNSLPTNSLQSADGLQLYATQHHPGQLDMGTLNALQVAMAQQQASQQQPVQQLPTAGRPAISLGGLAMDANSAEAALQMLATRGQAGLSAVVNAAMPQRSGDSRASGSAYASRHQAAEQRRRLRINERLDALRKLVPHAERANTACFLEEVIKYIGHIKDRCDQLEGALSGILNSAGPLTSNGSTSGGAAHPSDAAHGQGAPSRESLAHAAQVLGMPPQYPPASARAAATSSPTNLLLHLQRQVNAYTQLQPQHLQGAGLGSSMDGLGGMPQIDTAGGIGGAPPFATPMAPVDVSALLQNNKSPLPIMVEAGDARPGSVFRSITPSLTGFHPATSTLPPGTQLQHHTIIMPQPVHATSEPQPTDHQQPAAPIPSLPPQPKQEQHEPATQQPSSSSSAPLEQTDQRAAQITSPAAGVAQQPAPADHQPAQSAPAPAPATTTATTAATPPPPATTPTPAAGPALALPGLTAEQLQILLAQALEMQQQTARAMQAEHQPAAVLPAPAPQQPQQAAPHSGASAGGADRHEPSSPYSSEDSGMPFKKRKHMQQP